jgi:hypothetical protein
MWHCAIKERDPNKKLAVLTHMTVFYPYIRTELEI